MTKIEFTHGKYVLLLILFVGLPLFAPMSGQAMENTFLSHIRQLTYQGRRAGEGYFSADGQQLVFQSERENSNPFFQIYTLDLKTGNSHRISTGKGKTTCAFFHPISDRILFSSTHHDSHSTEKQQAEFDFRASVKKQRYSWDYDEDMEIYTANRLGQKLRRLTNRVGYDAEAAYSPNGKYIVFCSLRSAYPINQLSRADQKRLEIDPAYFGEIYLMNSDGSKIRRLTHQPGYDGGPFFSPDGKRIIWRRFTQDGLAADIFTMNLDGTDQKQITDFKSMSWSPYFHPSGEYVIFASNKLGFSNFELYLVDVKGGHQPVRVTDNDGFDGLPVFSPDGKQLCWTSNRTDNKQSQLFLADWNHPVARKSIMDSPRGKPFAFQSDITISDLQSQVRFLASDDLVGRMTGSPENRKAAEYIGQYLKQCGLQPLSDNYFQSFEFTAGVEVASGGNLFELHLANSVERLTIGTSYQPLSFTANRTISGEVVFAGYGLQVPGESFGSYDGLDVAGKVVLVFRYIPESVSMERRQQLNRYAGLRYKAMIARERGAKALLVITGPNSPNAGQLVPLSFDTSLTSGIVAASINGQIAGNFFALAGTDTKSVQQQLDVENPHAKTNFAIPGLRVKIITNVDRIAKNDQNVVGVLPGQIDEYIMVGAHYDHIGRGEVGSLAKKGEEGEIHNGADDNASGTAAVLEIAHAMPRDRNRGSIFAFWSGEELGLIGSSLFTEQPLIDLRKIVAYVNLDMIGRLRNNRLLVQGVGSSTQWTSLIEKHNVAIDLQLVVSDDPYLPTDVTAFYPKNIPVINLFTGGHENYNRPTDDPDTLNYNGLQRISQFATNIVADLANLETRLAYTKVKTKQSNVGSRNALRIYLGTIPDYTGNIVGVKLSGVRIDSPADKAGIRGKDVIVELAGQQITNIYDYTYVIDALKVGEETAIIVSRQGERVSLIIVPTVRN